MLTYRLAALALALLAGLAAAPVLTAAQQATPPPTAGQQPTPPPAAGQQPTLPAPAGQQPTPPAPAGQQPTLPSPVVIDIQGSPALGPDNAPVTIVEFGDFQCPSCAQGAKSLRRLHAIYPNRVRWVFKHYPLRTLHPAAALAHEAAVAAQEQGKFWEMHELIFQNQQKVKYKDLLGYAQEIGLDMVAFKDALDTRRLRPRVIHDMEEGRRLRVYATPTYYVNGVQVIGARTAAEFRNIVDTIARRPAAAPPEATAPAPGAPGSPAGSAGPAPEATAAPSGSASPPAESSTTR